MSDNQHQRDQMASAQRDHESEPERPDAAPPREEPTVRLAELVSELKDAAPPKRTPEETRGEHEIGFCWCGAHHDVPPPSDAAPVAEFVVDLAKFLERRFTPSRAMTLATYVLAHPEDAPRITMTKSYLSGRQCCDFTIAEDDSETHEPGCPWRIVDEFAKAVYKMDEDGKVVAPWLHDLVVGLEEDLTNSPIRHPEDAPRGPTEKEDPHWPYTRSVEGDLHRNCGGQLRYRVLNSDHDDRRYRCDKCKKTWVEEGADA